MRWSWPGMGAGRGSFVRMGPFQLIRLARHLPNFIKLVWRLFIDRRVGMLPRAVLVLAATAWAAYFVWPIDLLPDWFPPVLGIVDDVLIGYLAAKAFIALCPKWVVQEHVRRIDAGG